MCSICLCFLCVVLFFIFCILFAVAIVRCIVYVACICCFFCICFFACCVYVLIVRVLHLICYVFVSVCYCFCALRFVLFLFDYRAYEKSTHVSHRCLQQRQKSTNSNKQKQWQTQRTDSSPPLHCFVWCIRERVVKNVNEI